MQHLWERTQVRREILEAVVRRISQADPKSSAGTVPKRMHLISLHVAKAISRLDETTSSKQFHLRPADTAQSL